MNGSKQAQETPYTPACLASYAQKASQPAPSPQAPYDAQEAPYEAQDGTQAFASSPAYEAFEAQASFASSRDAQASCLASSWLAPYKGASRERVASCAIRLFLAGGA